MLKFTKGLFGILGLAAAACLAYFMVKMFWRYNTVQSMAIANHASIAQDPKVFMWLAPAAALLTGLLIGIALALPRRTARSIRNESRAAFEHDTTVRPAEVTADRRVADDRVVTDDRITDDRRI